jgi:hypothetical protein
MDFTNLVAAVELAVVCLAIILGVVIAFVFFRAWWRSNKGVFLLLLFGYIATVCVNTFTAVVLFFSVSHIRLVPADAVQPLYAAQAVFAFIGVVLSFIGNLLVVRLALLACSRTTPNHAMQPTAGHSAL